MLKERPRLLIEDLPMAREQQRIARQQLKDNPGNLTLIGKVTSTTRFVETILGASHRHV